MASVPNTNTFSLEDVTSVVGGVVSLTEAFANANGTFDPNYSGSMNSLYNFRNYQSAASYVLVDATYYTDDRLNFRAYSYIDHLRVFCEGGGGCGGARSTNGLAGGGGGGGFSYKTDTSTRYDPGSDRIDIYVGAGGTNASKAGGSSYVQINSTNWCLANGGQGVNDNDGNGAAGASTFGAIGDIKYSGGVGGTAYISYSGGGGGGAGTGGNGGGAGQAPSPGNGTSSGGGNGGSGVNNSNNTAGNDGHVCGGGGSGASRLNAGTIYGGNGYQGYVRVEYWGYV